MLGTFAATPSKDVTGFGLSGHLRHMTTGSGVAAEVWADRLPLIDGVAELVAAGATTGGAKRNARYVADGFTLDPSCGPEIEAITHDPQTSGGLLVRICDTTRGGGQRLRSRPAW